MVDTNKKGSRNERKAKDILNCFKHVKAEKITQRSNVKHDFFGLADVLGIDNDTGELYMIQVKTNQNFSEKKAAHYTQFAHIRLNNRLHHFELWNRNDREGWEFYRFNPNMKEDDEGYFHHESWGGLQKYFEVDKLNDPRTIAKELLSIRPEEFIEEANTMQEEHNRKEQIQGGDD